ncbi:MAG: hypothetical protein IJ721_00255 [Bacteroidales bacterium]|nr:hypothetical protein [Bacteroidales bacterium]
MTPLSGLVARKALDVKSSERIVERLCVLLEARRQAGTGYGALSAGNVWVDDDGHVALREDAEPLSGALHDDMVALGVLLWSLPCRRRDVVDRCCDPDPARRYQTFPEVAEALHRSGRAALWAGIAFIAAAVLFTLLQLV